LRPLSLIDFGLISNFFSILKKRIGAQSSIWNSPTQATNTV
jgi:hypothetical protein